MDRSRLQALRQATQETHASLDAHPVLQAFLKNGERTAYIRFLKAFEAMLLKADESAARWLLPADRLAFSYEGWREGLASDLAALDAPKAQYALPPLVDTAGASWGLFYVLEGSALGGTQLSACVAELGWPDAFLARGSDRQRWPLFCRRLCEQSWPEAEICEGANYGFATMIDLLEKPL